MKHKKYFFLLLLFCGINFPGVNAQTLSQIIASHIKAIGGKEKIKQVKTVVMKMKTVTTLFEDPDSVKFTTNSLVRITNGKGYRSDNEIDKDGFKLSGASCFTDNTGDVSGWVMNGATNKGKPRTMSEQEYNAGKDGIYIGSPFINYPSQEMEVALLKKFNGQYCISIKTGFWARLYYLDINTFYISRIEENAAMGYRYVTIFRDYRNISGIAFPHHIAINKYPPKGMGDIMFGHGATDWFDDPLSLSEQNPKEKANPPSSTVASTVTGITVNEPIDSSIYNFPED